MAADGQAALRTVVAAPARRLRQRVHSAVDPRARPQGLSAFNRVVAALIVASTAVAVLDSEPAVARRLGHVFTAAEARFFVAFAAEHALRLCTAPRATRPR